MSDRLPPNIDSPQQNYKGQILATDDDGYVRKVKIDQNGELKVDAWADKHGNENFNAIFGEKFIASRKPIISANFNYPPDMREINITTLNGASLTYEVSKLTLNSGTNPNGQIIYETKNSVRYRSGRDLEFMATIVLDAPVEGNSRKFGLYTDQNGIYIGYNDLEFGLGVRKSGEDIFIPQSEWNIDKCDGTGYSKFDINFQAMNIFRLNWGFLGIAPILLQWYGGFDKGWITAHAYDIVNISDDTHIDMPYLPIRMTNTNTTNITNVKIQSASVYAGTVDGSEAFDSSSREFSRTLSLVGITAGVDKPILTFHNKENYQSVANKIDAQLLRVGLATDGTKTVTITLYKLDLTPTGGDWVDIDTLNSALETSINTTVNLAGAEVLMAWALGKTDSVNDDVDNLNLLLHPNEYACFTYTSTGSSDVNFANRHSEKF